jgi:hypothetical protein
MAVLKTIISKRCNGLEEVLYEFSMKNDLYRKYALNAMLKERMHSFLLFLYQYGDSLDSPTLFFCIASLNEESPWLNDSLLDYVTFLGTNHSDAVIRMFSLNYLFRMGRFIDCQKLLMSLKLEPDQRVKVRIYGTLLRYNNVGLNKEVSIFIAGMEKFDLVISDNLTAYNRYDFLPELYTLRKRMQAETNPLRKTDSEQILKTLTDVIPYLEKKKTENAPIGLPLDWPGDSK